MSMRDTLIHNIEALVAAYGGHIPISVSRALKAIGMKQYDASHISRVVANRSNFTIELYDRVIQAFSDAWPKGVSWPDGVDRPAATDAAERSDDSAAA